MSLGEYLPLNNLFLLLSGLAVAIIALVWFLRKPQNRHPMSGEHGRELEERRARENAQGVTERPPARDDPRV